VVCWFVAMAPELVREFVNPAMRPGACHEAEVKSCSLRMVKPGKLNSLVPLELCVNSPLAPQSTDTGPVGPAKVTKLGLPVVLVRSEERRVGKSVDRGGGRLRNRQRVVQVEEGSEWNTEERR